MVYYDKDGIVIRDLRRSDAQVLTNEELAQGWDATIDKYENICYINTILIYERIISKFILYNVFVWRINVWLRACLCICRLWMG